jgi:SAM-dependent methyltransferase
VSLLPPEQFFRFFRSPAYLRHNQRRLEHLVSLGLPLRNATVLEVGAGIGDHTSFFVDRDCKVTAVEARPENLRVLREIHSQVESLLLDLDDPDAAFCVEFDIVYCYGLLYHLRNPADAIAYMAERCRRLLLLETCVSFGDGKLVNQCSEDANDPTQAFSGMGCRPTRDWVHSHLKEHFEYVYLPISQPNHEEFPIDWSQPENPNRLSRSVFVASRSRLSNDKLTEAIPVKQDRH